MGQQCGQPAFIQSEHSAKILRIKTEIGPNGLARFVVIVGVVLTFVFRAAMVELE